MTAQTLRDAAKVLRERAEVATPGPWGFTDSEAAASLVNIPDDGMVVSVGLALARWLEDEAARRYHTPTPPDHALTVARAILGGAA